MKDASVPTVAIIDIDMLNSETDLSKAISGYCSEFNQSEIISLRAELATHIEEVPEEDIKEELKKNVAELLEQLNNNEHSLSGARGALNRIRAESTKWSMIKKEGIEAMQVEFRQKAQKIIDESKKVGLYIVPVGEVESWIDLEVRKNRWALPALEAIHEGRCPNNLKMFVGDIIKNISNH